MIIDGCAGIEDFSGLLFLFELSEHDDGQDHQQKQSKYDSWPHDKTFTRRAGLYKDRYPPSLSLIGGRMKLFNSEPWMESHHLRL